MTPQRVTLITLGVSDLDASTAFYAALGWTPKEHLPEARFYQINGMVLGLFGLENLAKDQGRPHAKLGVGGATLG
jgi:catechol 2,3-dioxygenase-like lactoylglutathione lyase family enzyme